MVYQDYTRKCRSKKHRFGGCGDPKCPEGLYLKSLMESAIKRKDISAYFDAKELSRTEPTYAMSETSSDGWVILGLKDPVSEKMAEVRVPQSDSPYIQELKKKIRKIDFTEIPSFNKVEDIEEYSRKTFEGKVFLILRKHKSYDPNFKWESLSVSQITIKADIRGLGIAKYLKKIIVKHSEENNLILSGTPTNKGDGFTVEGQEGHTEKALAHRARLEKAYIDNGYIKNPCWLPLGSNIDYLTKKPYEINYKDHEKFTPEAMKFLQDLGIFVRFPNKKIPEEFFA